eukprot:maker-scaffold_8-snap-gene-5.0-mRNA-1 protein AED:0.18 eAED:0.20 QI:0/0/0/1/1/1/2/0/466
MEASHFVAKNHDGPLLVEIYLVLSLTTVLSTRLFLYATGYPQLSSGEIHIAHMLWGGLLMFTSQIINFLTLGQTKRRFCSVIGGIGFGLFIDEIGKVITKDNDYFFEPTITILYLLFCFFFLDPFYSATEKYSLHETVVNLLDIYQNHFHSGMTLETRLLFFDFMQNYERKAENFMNEMQAAKIFEAMKTFEQRNIVKINENRYIRFRRVLARGYTNLVSSKFSLYSILVFFSLQCFLQFYDLLWYTIQIFNNQGLYTFLFFSEDVLSSYNQVKTSKLLYFSYLENNSSNFNMERTNFNGESKYENSFFYKALNFLNGGLAAPEVYLKHAEVLLDDGFQIFLLSFMTFCTFRGLYLLSKNMTTPNLNISCRSGSFRRRRNERSIGNNQRLIAFIWFRRGCLIRLLVTNTLLLYDQSVLRAFLELCFSLLGMGSLTFVIMEENTSARKRRLSTFSTTSQEKTVSELT